MNHQISRQPLWSAHKILRDYGIDAPDQIDLNAICLDKGILVIEAPLKGALARLIRNGKDKALIRVSDRILEVGRRRFAIAHEFGHFMLHREKNQLSLCQQSELLFWYKGLPPEEQEANTFAVELLMPNFLFEPRCSSESPTVATIKKLSTEFEMSLTATTLRYLDFTRHDCAAIVSCDGKMTWFKTCETFPLRLLDMGTMVDPSSLAGQLFAGDPYLDGPQQVPIEMWVEDQEFSQSFTIQEDAVYLERYQTVISLISIQPNSPLNRSLTKRAMSATW